ncbi:xanthine dehydrogenase family protein molybdopterin-binding subunit [Litorilituus lipolyticus]|uniref:Xanthine dehydrogenase family protein molybdopterin-binding subunit n=1 Tax=Litorilituus lipolyticus TaxID=2491017 RepID=A0A502L0U4_9GAMM|nr:molybdopterin cofactor-binding domain-containing protein [Litorilituus lipolyticus]TPH16409.1 xanthine dehydrogenase family protein molybdopterin-binding subunit [Litorilituus lipolyticus]
MKIIENVSRRNFIKLAGITAGSFALGVHLPLTKAQANTLAEHQINFFISFNDLGDVSIICHRSEMGQGIRTSIPQIIADELGADWNKVSVVQAKADAKYGPQGTAGSASIRSHFTTIRQVGAAAREMLEQAAANIWQVNKSAVSAKKHFVYHNKTGEKITFGELAKHAAKLTAPDVNTITLKSQHNFSLIGKNVKQVDLDNIVTGQAEYAQDIELPDMLIAVIQRPKVVGAVVKSFDASEAKKVKGVVDVIQLKPRKLPAGVYPLSGVAVLATNTWAATEGKKKLSIEWDTSNVAAASKHDSKQFTKQLKAQVNTKGAIVRRKGDVYRHNYDEANTVEATYSIPYLHHAPMETPAATAIVTSEKCTIWAGTQNPQWAQGMVAQELGIPREEIDKIELNVTLMGGAFGRKSKGDFIIEAVELAQKTNKPVKVVWTREDDVQHGFYHSSSANYFKAQVNGQGQVDNLIARTAYPPIAWLWDEQAKHPSDSQLSLGFADMPFELNSLSLEKHDVDSYVRPGWLRSVACINNGFALGSFVDELAVKANKSPRAMWLSLIGSDREDNPSSDSFKYSNYDLDYKDHPVDTKRMKSLINLISDKANIEEELPSNQGWGISFLRSFGSYVAAATKVQVVNNKIEVLEMHTAVDCGIVVTPDRVEAQMEGAMIFGLSIALMGEISVSNGAVEQNNFYDYPVTRINQAPKMFVHLVNSKKPPGGIGEPGVPPVVPSITNAIYHASKIRIRDLPINKVMEV